MKGAMTMFNRFNQILAPPIFENAEEKTRVAKQINTITWVMLAGTALYSIAYPIFAPQLIGRLFLVIPIFLLLAGILALIRYGEVRLASVLLVTGTWALLIFYAAVSGGVRAPGFSGAIIIV